MQDLKKTVPHRPLIAYTNVAARTVACIISHYRVACIVKSAACSAVAALKVIAAKKTNNPAAGMSVNERTKPKNCKSMFL